MNVSIVHYSRKGTTSGVAERIAGLFRELGHQTTTVLIKHQKPPGFFKASRESLKGGTPPIANPEADLDLSSADLVVLGGPIFAGNVSAWVRSYMEGASGLSGKPAGVFVCCNSRPDEADDYAAKMMELANHYGLNVRARMVASNKDVEGHDQRARSFVQELLGTSHRDVGGEADEDDGGDEGDGGGDGGGDGDGDGE